MSDWGYRCPGYALIPGTPVQTNQTTSGTGYSAWAQIPGTSWASLPSPLDAIWVDQVGADSAGYLYVELGEGAAASENVFLENFGMYHAGLGTNTGILVPVRRIPAGRRIAIRSRQVSGAGATNQLYFAGYTLVGPTPPFAFPSYSMGVTRSSGAMTTFAAGTTWTQLVAATPQEAQGFILSISDSSIPADGGKFVEVAYGAAGAEQVVFSHLVLPNRATSIATPYPMMNIAVPAPAGTRVAARARVWFGSVGTQAAALWSY